MPDLTAPEKAESQARGRRVCDGTRAGTEGGSSGACGAEYRGNTSFISRPPTHTQGSLKRGWVWGLKCRYLQCSGTSPASHWAQIFLPLTEFLSAPYHNFSSPLMGSHLWKTSVSTLDCSVLLFFSLRCLFCLFSLVPGKLLQTDVRSH